MDEVGRAECVINEGDYVIIGFPKAGTVSLQNFLRKKKKKKIHRRELIYLDDGPDIFEKNYKGCIPVIIKRNPIDRLWSAYNYYQWLKSIPFKEWVLNEKHINQIGTNSPIKSCDYDYFIKRFERFNPQICDLESNKGSFEVLNSNTGKPPIPPEYREFLERLL